MPYNPNKEVSKVHNERPWVYAYGAMLAATAGFVNVLLLGIYHVPVSHMTGAVARIAIDISSGNRSDFWGAMTIFIGFLCGAILSGLIIGSTRVEPGRRYGVAMMIEASLLSLAAILLVNGNTRSGIPMASMACGLQNAMASSYCGLILRTTHVSGMVTDIGVLIGHWIRYHHIEYWKLTLLVVIFLGFILGGISGGISYSHYGIYPLFGLAAGCFCGGLGYFIWRIQRIHDFPIDRWGYFPPTEDDDAL